MPRMEAQLVSLYYAGDIHRERSTNVTTKSVKESNEETSQGNNEGIEIY